MSVVSGAERQDARSHNQNMEAECKKGRQKCADQTSTEPNVTDPAAVTKQRSVRSVQRTMFLPRAVL